MNKMNTVDNLPSVGLSSLFIQHYVTIVLKQLLLKKLCKLYCIWGTMKQGLTVANDTFKYLNGR